MKQIYFIIVFLFIGCSAQVGTDRAPEGASQEIQHDQDRLEHSLQSNGSTVELKELPSSKRSEPPPVDEIQLLWEIPEVPVDNYIIYYGFSRNSMTNVIKLNLFEVETFEDPRFGTVHRYTLTNIPIDKTVYVSIAAMRGDTVSKAGDVIELKPEGLKKR